MKRIWGKRNALHSRGALTIFTVTILSSAAPYTTVSILLQYNAPAHQTRLHRNIYFRISGRYLLPKKLKAEVSAMISACAVGSLNFYLVVTPRFIIFSFCTIIAPTGTSSDSKAFFSFFQCHHHTIFVGHAPRKIL